MNLKQKLIVIILTLTAISLQSTYATESLSTGVDQLVRAQLWHQGIEAIDSNETENGTNSFKSEVNYPEELIVAVEKLDQEKR